MPWFANNQAQNGEPGLMPKRTKSLAKPNKSAFVRSLAFDTPSAQVIAKAKAKGMTLTRNDVHAIRAIARRKQARGKGGAARAAKRSGGVNKSAFVRSLAATLSAADVISRAKTKGIKLSAAQVYTIRANARRKTDVPTMTRMAGLQGAFQPAAGKRGRRGAGNSESESAFLLMALELGLLRAEGILGSLRDRAVGLG
jgi:UDP-N-acetylenolpyruvoylglucosamine reductase